VTGDLGWSSSTALEVEATTLSHSLTCIVASENLSLFTYSY